MSKQRTLSIIKPDATSKNIIGKIIDRFEENDLKVVAGKLIHMNETKAAGFYAEHEGRPFFPNLVEYMTSAPVFVQVLEGDNAVLKNRELMGATNPEDAEAARDLRGTDQRFTHPYPGGDNQVEDSFRPSNRSAE